MSMRPKAGPEESMRSCFMLTAAAAMLVLAILPLIATGIGSPARPVIFGEMDRDGLYIEGSRPVLNVAELVVVLVNGSDDSPGNTSKFPMAAYHNRVNYYVDGDANGTVSRGDRILVFNMTNTSREYLCANWTVALVDFSTGTTSLELPLCVGARFGPEGEAVGTGSLESLPIFAVLILIFGVAYGYMVYSKRKKRMG